MAKLKKQSTLKRVLTDIAGFGLIFLGVAFGWLPGPGGIPLILAGLAILAKNYTWAERLQNHLLAIGKNALKTFFPEHPFIRILYDVIMISLVVAGLLIIYQTTGKLWDALAVLTICVALVIFLGNRQRLERITDSLKK